MEPGPEPGPEHGSNPGVRPERSGRRPRVLLASTSPRRLELLQQLGLQPAVHAVPIDETPVAGESPKILVRRLARAKALAAPAPAIDAIVLAADTVIDLDGRVLGKPVDAVEAEDMVLALAGREHCVISGVAVRRRLPASRFGDSPGDSPVFATHVIAVETRVRFGRISREAARRYAESDEPLGKAGAYAIQGFAAQFVASLSGSYSNVVGLPLHETARLLLAAGGSLWPPRTLPPA